MMAYGKERRKFIKNWFTANPTGRYCVNTKHRPQVKEDPDLKKLIRMGFLKQQRDHISRTSAWSYLVKA
jgi:hypothetical protein